MSSSRCKNPKIIQPLALGASGYVLCEDELKKYRCKLAENFFADVRRTTYSEKLDPKYYEFMRETLEGCLESKVTPKPGSR